jgi:hypothetical protein
LNSVEQHITATINNSIDFEWIRCKKYTDKWSSQAEGHREVDEYTGTSIGH